MEEKKKPLKNSGYKKGARKCRGTKGCHPFCEFPDDYAKVQTILK